MKPTLAELTALLDAGIVGQCAIGGAMGAKFYILTRHNLLEAWAKFKTNYLPPTP
jgi:hypothetical protein